MRKLRTGLMPPKGEPRPERSVLDGMAAELERELDAAAARAPNPGAKPLARLNRTEYANAIRDLLAFDAGAIAGTLPPDASVGGFDNIAAALSVSPTLLEGYALAAMQIGRRAVGDRTMGHGETRYAAAGGAAQQRHIEGLPLGTRGGLAVEHNFPLDAEYEFDRAGVAACGRLGQPDGAARVLRRPERRARVQRRADRARRAAARRGCACRRARSASPSRSSTSSAAPGVNELYLGEVAIGAPSWAS